MALRNFPVFSSLAPDFSDRFSRIDRLFSQLTGDTPVSSVPPYDLRQLDEERYTLSVSVPGWKEQELEIESAGGRLSITGSRAETTGDGAGSTEEENGRWLHRGISRTDFRLSFTIPEHMKVTGARLEAGLLAVGLHQEIPETQKPRRIPIESKNAGAIEHQAD